MMMLYTNLCYNEVCYTGTSLQCAFLLHNQAKLKSYKNVDSKTCVKRPLKNRPNKSSLMKRSKVFQNALS